MRTVKFIIAAAMSAVLGMNSFAQTHDHAKMTATKTETIKVYGNCDLCKTHIEKSAKIEGVSKATWNKDTKILTLVYNPAVVKSDDVQKKIAAGGYDTEKFKADNKAYSSLPKCCQYERKK